MSKFTSWLAQMLHASGRVAAVCLGFVVHPSQWRAAIQQGGSSFRHFWSETRHVWGQFCKLTKIYFTSERKWYAFGLMALVIAFMLAVNGINVLINHVQGSFQTSLSEKAVPEYWHWFWVYVSVFAFSTPIVVLYQWLQDKFTMRWREWLTRHLLDKYFQNRSYYHVNNHPEIDNPDERLSEDVNNFTATAISLFISSLSSIVALASFLTIIWSISPTLLLVAFGYSVIFSLIMITFGRKLIRLNFRQRRVEADFRYGLIRVRNNVESIAFYRGENKENASLKERFFYVISNYNLLIGWQRNMGMVKTVYDYTNALLPALIIAPLYFAGLVKFGVISQASDAFGQVMAALSLVIASWDDLSDFIALTRRLGQFYDVVNAPQPKADPKLPTIKTVESGVIRFDGVGISTPDRQRELVRALTLAINSGQGLMVVGRSGTGKTSVLRALTELWNAGTGTIYRPRLSDMLFLPQRPYMILGSLREQMAYPNLDKGLSDNDLRNALAAVRLDDLPKRFAREGGFDAELPWEYILSLGEQQRLSFTRVLLTKRPNVILDEATSALDESDEERLYKLLRGSGATFMSVGHRVSLIKHHDHVLELVGDTSWALYTAAAYKEKLDKEHREHLS